jgi:hypothetical protein
VPSATRSEQLDYDSSVWFYVTKVALLAICMGCANAAATQEDPGPPKSSSPASEPHYDSTFSGPIVELTAERVTVSRSILGKPAEKRSFWIKPDTRIEGKLRLKVKVTVGFVTTEDGGDIARLIVVRVAAQKK